MKDRLKIILILAFLLTSCAMEEAFEPEVPEVETELPDSVFFILADPAPLTRVTYAGDGLHADFEKEDLVGCFALNDDLTAAEGEGFKPNACYRVSVHTNITTGEDRRFLSPVTDSDDLNKSKTKYLFYYPYDPEITSLNQLKKYTHSVNTDQNDRDRYEASDLLWDICTPIAELKSVEVEMDHAMAQIIVEVESGLIKEGTVPTLLDIPTTVSKLDLVKLDLDAMTSGLHEAGAYELSTAVDNVVMWEFGYATSGNLMFRAAVPANHTISSGSKILSLENPEGNEVTYRLSKGLSFEPGKTYLMTLVSEREIVSPDEVGDDETWVYDVLDPETMEPVGLLCKEYIRYQPALANNAEQDYPTGTPYPDSENMTTKAISSQAWTFYKMNGNVPDLRSAQIMRFISDVRTTGWSDRDKGITSIWPFPHTWHGNGLFTPDHGHNWVEYKDPDLNITYGKSSDKAEIQHDMHGGTIVWDGSENKIISFALPDKSVKGEYDIITNEIAATQGHIAIPQDGDPYVCYHEITSSPPHKIGLLVPHYLIDRRVGRAKTVEERMYPLVKIGYNQFWMSLSLRAATLTDGTPLPNFNSDQAGKVTFSATDEVPPGFIYGSAVISNESKNYNPYFDYPDPKQREELKLSAMYNFSTLLSGKMLPKSYTGISEYYIPSRDDVIKMFDYLGWLAFAKMTTRRIRTKIGQDLFSPEATIYDSYLKGQYTDVGYNFYAANICGLDFRAEGCYTYESLGGLGSVARVLVVGSEPGDTDNLYLLGYNAYEVFTTDVFAKLDGDNQVFVKSQGDGSHDFAPIRFFMKFDGQADTGGGVSLSSLAKGLATKSSSAPVENRDVYVGLEPVEAEL